METQLQEWLAVQGQMVVGARAGLAVVGVSAHAPGALVARWPQPESVTPRLSSTVELARRRGEPVVQEAALVGAPAAGGSTSAFALPVLLDGAVVGAVGVSVEGLSPPQIKAAVEQLGRSVRGLEVLLSAQAKLGRLDTLVGFAGSLLERETLAEATHALAGELARALGCERVAIGRVRRGRLAVVALSTSLRFSKESDAVRDIRGAMEEAVDQDARIELPSAADTGSSLQGAAIGAGAYAALAHERLAGRSGARTVYTTPLAERGEAIGAVVCEWSEANALSRDRRDALEDAATLCGPVLGLLVRADAGPLERARDGLLHWAERRLGADRRVVFATIGALVAIVVALGAAPTEYRVSSRASLEGRVQRALVAAVDGYLSESHARAGDLVRAGDVLARLDDRDLELRRRRQQSQAAQLEKEYREALAGQDRTQISILRSQIEKANAELRLAEEELGRTSVAAPFDGIIVEGNLDQALGSPVARGELLFKLAPLEGYRIIVEVDDRDIADVAPGQRGQLALSALPGRPLPFVVERVTPIATTREGRNYFRVEAALEESVDALRPGMEGIAKVEVGERRLLWIFTHEMLDWLRLRAWSFLP